MTEFGDSNQETESEIFFRTSDRLQMESCARALAHEAKSLVIASATAELLDYYGAAFVRRLKKELPQTSFEVFMPSDTEAMLVRFNKLLTTMKLDEATQLRTQRAPEKIWVVHDANALAPHELELFTRLILQFPGAGVGAILMFTGETATAESMVKPNKQFVVWSLELPTAEQKLSAIQQARKNGEEAMALAFFNRLSKAQAKKSIPFQSAADAATSVASKKETQSKPTRQKRTYRGSLIWFLWISGLLCVSVGVTALLYPELGDKAVSHLKIWTGQVDPASEPVDSSGLAKGEEKLDVPKPAQQLDEANNPMTRGVPDSRTPVAETQSAASVVEAKVEPQIEKPVKVITELPETAVNGRIWLKGLPEDSFVLEHQVFDSIKEAQASIKGKEWLVNARIVPVYAESKDEAKFAVITGPFKSKDRAKNTIARLRLSNDVTIKSVPAALAQSGVKPTKP